MRVLMFGWEFPPHTVGGLGVACFGLTRALVREGVELSFVLPEAVPVESPFMKFCFGDNEKHRVTKVPVYLIPYLTSEGFLKDRPWQKDPQIANGLVAEVLRYAAHAKRISKEENFDVIHAHDWLSIPAGLAAKKESGKPLVIHVHATEYNRSGGNGANPIVYDIEREGFQKADSVVTISEQMSELLQERYAVPKEKITIAYNGIDGDYFDTISGTKTAKARDFEQLYKKLHTDGSKVVLFAGRVTLQKGPDYFIELAKRVLSLRPKTYFLVAGTGDMNDQVIHQIAASGHSDRIIFTGAYKNEQARDVFGGADLFVLTSVSEPFGLTPLEAIACGTPTIITKQSGVAEILVNSLKVDFWDMDEMVNKTIALLDNPALAQVIETEAKHELPTHDWSHAARILTSLYKSLTAKPAFVPVVVSSS